MSDALLPASRRDKSWGLMSVRVTCRFDDEAKTGDSWGKAAYLDIADGDELVEVVEVGLTATAAMTVVGVLGDKDDVLLLLGVYGLARLANYLADPSWRDQTVYPEFRSWRLSSDEALSSLSPLASEKQCAYQRVGTDLYCATPSNDDISADREVDGLRVAPTTSGLCRGCQVPDSRSLCSAFTHPRVTALGTAELVEGRRVQSAMCAADHNVRASEDAAGCRIGGHPCWHWAPAAPVAPDPVRSPLALPEAIDYLDTTWRLAFGGRRLVRGASLADIAGLSMSCQGRSDFDHRLSDLAGLVESLVVDDVDVPAGAQGERPSGSIARIEAALRQRLGADLPTDVAGAFATIRKLVRIRNTIQHPGAADEAPKLFASLGLTWPPSDWTYAWEVTRGHAVAAVSAIRTEVRRLS